MVDVMELKQHYFSSIAEFIEAATAGYFNEISDCVLTLHSSPVNNQALNLLRDTFLLSDIPFQLNRFIFVLNNVVMDSCMLKTISVIAATQRFASMDLSMQACGIDDKDAEIVAEILWSGHFPQDSIIDLYGNVIGDEGLEAIANGIKSGNAPVHLTLRLDQYSTNRITEKGMTCLTDAIKHENCPEGLKITMSYYGLQLQPSVEMMCDALEENNRRYERNRKAIINCRQFQEGARQNGNIIQVLPKDLFGVIYSHVFEGSHEKKIQRILTFFGDKPQIKKRKVEAECENTVSLSQ